MSDSRDNAIHYEAGQTPHEQRDFDRILARGRRKALE